MAAIGSIRKHGILLMCIIGIALLAFVMGDVSKLSSFYSDKYTMVKINSKKLDDEYRTRLEQNSALWKIFYEKSTLDETENYQVHDMTWNQLLEQTIMEQQLKNLGLSFTQEMITEANTDMIASLRTEQPNQLLYRLASFLTTQFAMEDVVGFLSNLEEYKNENGVRDIYNAYKAIERFALIDKQKARYMALAQNTISFSDEAMKYYATTNNTLLTQLVTVFPNAAQFNDLEITVTDKEVQDWFNKYKIRYKIKDNSRDIDVAMLPIQPSPEDLAAIRDTAMNRAARLKAAPSIEDYNISMMLGQLDSIYFKRSDLQIDTLAKLIFDRPVGTFIEPLEYENVVWYYGKTYGAAKRPDSLYIAYLVIDYKTDRNPNSARTQTEAKTTADSLKGALQKGENIFPLIPDYYGGRRGNDTIIWATEHSFSKPTFNALLTQNVYVEDASSAFIVYQVFQRTAPVEKRLFVIYTEEIKPSDATVKAIRSQAMQLQAESNSAEELMTSAAQKGIQATQGKDVTSMMASIAQLQNAREIVSWAFNPDTKVNDVSDVYTIDNKLFAVAAIRGMKKKGDPKVEDVREAIETELKAVKKLESIQNTVAEKLNSGSTLQQIAETYQSSFQDSVKLIFGGETYQNRNIENAAIGKIFALPTAKPTAVAGKNNLFVVSIYEQNEAGEASPNFAMEKQALKNAVAGRSRNESSILEGLKEKATILDQRYLYFSR
jgi:peptidyl-prolyl cis-trans isomerase D